MKIGHRIGESAALTHGAIRKKIFPGYSTFKINEVLFVGAFNFFLINIFNQHFLKQRYMMKQNNEI